MPSMLFLHMPLLKLALYSRMILYRLAYSKVKRMFQHLYLAIKSFGKAQELKRSTFLVLSAILMAGSFSVLPSTAENADYHFQQAMNYEFAGNSDAAIAEYRRALKSAPESVDGHTRLGTLLLDEEGDVDGAISEFVTALSIDPKCHSCQSRLDEAVDKKNANVRDGINRGNELYRTGQLKRATAAYRIAVSVAPDDSEARNCLAWTLYRVGKLEDAKNEVNFALKLKPDEAEYVNTLACIQYDQGETEAAIDSFRKAIAKSKTPNPADLYGLAIGFLTKGDKETAIKNFKEAVKSDANYTNARYLRDKIGLSAHALATHEKLMDISGEAEKAKSLDEQGANNHGSEPTR